MCLFYILDIMFYIKYVIGKINVIIIYEEIFERKFFFVMFVVCV